MESAWAAYSAAWDGTLKAVTPVGKVYAVYTPEELAWVAQQNNVRNGWLGDTIKLYSDIDLGGGIWLPIGSAAQPFAGVFAGQGHLVRGLTIVSAADGAGLFGHVAEKGRITQLGMTGDRLLANNKRNVGGLVGVLDGCMDECWSMMPIQTAGNCVGGLIGQTREHAKVSNCYSAAPILSAKDTIGAFVGYANGGSFSYCYAIGYAANGNGFVGIDKSGLYSQCMFDRKMYYLHTGTASKGIWAMDITKDMFTCWNSNSLWTCSLDLYPRLSVFAATDAAIVSVTPVYLDINATEPVEHANDISQDFTFNTANGVSWHCEDAQYTEYVNISGSSAAVTRPCVQKDGLIDAVLGDERKVVYTRLRRWEDFDSGDFSSEQADYCHNSYVPLTDSIDIDLAKGGMLGGDYYYTVVLYRVQGTDTLDRDTLLDDVNTETYVAWHKDYLLPTDSAGEYILQRFARDEYCYTDWKPSKGSWKFTILHFLDPGLIVTAQDTVYGIPANLNVPNLQAATGGGGAIGYVWYVNGERIWSQNKVSLTNYMVTAEGTYRFNRSVYDQYCFQVPETADYSGTYTWVVLPAFDPGDVLSRNLSAFCDVVEPQSLLIEATEASGGAGGYSYQWYMVVGNDTDAIAGATDKDLSLQGLTFDKGKTYTFFRVAEDSTRFTKMTHSRGEQKVRILSSFDAGQIETKTLDSKCVYHTYVVPFDVVVNSLKPATGEGSFEYRWYRAKEDGTEEIEIANTEDLDYTFKPDTIDLGYTYIYYRKARNITCGSDWVLSDGVVKQYYEANDHKDSTVYVCETAMPFTVYYPAPDNWRYSHTFTYDGETHLFHDPYETTECMPTRNVTLQVVPAPEIADVSKADICQDVLNTISIPYTVLSGRPDSFYIEFSPNMEKYVGTKTVTGTMEALGVGETGYIRLTGLQRIGVGDNYLHLRVGNRRSTVTGGDICFGADHFMELEFSLGGYLYSKFDRLIFVDNEPDSPERLTFSEYQWYKDGVIIPGATGQYYHEDGRTLIGTFYALLTVHNNGERITYKSCEMTLPEGGLNGMPVRDVYVYPVPVNAGASFTIVSAAGEARIVSSAGVCVAVVALHDGENTVSAPLQSGCYTVVITSPDNTKRAKLIVR